MTADPLYKSGIRSENEAVISAHFMHAQNLNPDYSLYSDEAYQQSSLRLPLGCMQQELIPLLQREMRVVAEARAAAALRRAGNKGVVVAIAELALDRWFRKGARDNVSFEHLCSQISHSLSRGEPVRLVAPLLPFKKDCPLKTRGTLACMAEVDLLCRLGELTEAIALIRHHCGSPARAGQAGAVFTILGDGQRFLTALNIDTYAITRYQQDLQDWIGLLGLQQRVELVDYETMVLGNLSRAGKGQREMLRLNALGLYQSCMAPLFDPDDIETALQRAVEADPLPDTTHSEGRFVPLFKSILYTYQYTFLSDYCARHQLQRQDLYRKVMLQTLQPCPAQSPEAYRQVYDYVHGSSDTAPAESDIIAYLRRQVLHAAWNATISYLAAVKMDRDLLSDPVASFMPQHIRYTIHAKPGQIGLRTTTSTQSASVVQPWHGVSILRPDGCGVLRFDTTSRLQAEGTGARPVVLSDDACTSCHNCGSDYLQRFAGSQQPFFYLHPSIQVANCNELLHLMARELTRRVN